LREFGCPGSIMVVAFAIAGKSTNAAKIPILFIEKSLFLISYCVNVDCNLPSINIFVQKYTL